MLIGRHGTRHLTETERLAVHVHANTIVPVLVHQCVASIPWIDVSRWIAAKDQPIGIGRHGADGLAPPNALHLVLGHVLVGKNLVRARRHDGRDIRQIVVHVPAHQFELVHRDIEQKMAIQV